MKAIWKPVGLHRLHTTDWLQWTSMFGIYQTVLLQITLNALLGF